MIFCWGTPITCPDEALLCGVDHRFAGDAILLEVDTVTITGASLFPAVVGGCTEEILTLIGMVGLTVFVGVLTPMETIGGRLTFFLVVEVIN